MRHEDYIYTNYLMAMSPNIETIVSIRDSLIKKYANNTKRMLLANAKNQRDELTKLDFIDYVGDDYLYNETWDVFRDTIINIGGKSKGKPAILSQILTTEELAKDDLLDLQGQPHDKELSIINRWIKKINYFNDQATMMAKPWSFGYISLYGGDVMTEEYENDPRNTNAEPREPLTTKYGMITWGVCPKCGNDAPMEHLHFRNICNKCKFPEFSTKPKKFIPVRLGILVN